MGSGDFDAIGAEFLGHFLRLADLSPDDDVLDVGCGIGRMALPLTGYLQGGTYRGMDIVPGGIKWCERHIASEHPNFGFVLADVHNSVYNPRGRHRAEDYRFPFPDESFDLVVLTSVFTHMLPEEVLNYMSEVTRVLRPGGRCFMTWFLLNGKSLEGIESGASWMRFDHQIGEMRTTDPTSPESAIAMPEWFVRDACARVGLRIKEPIRFGAWSGRQDFLSAQDIVVAVREPSPERA